MFKPTILKVASLALCLMGYLTTPIFADTQDNFCASKREAKKVLSYFSENAGAPLAIPARDLKFPELKIATALLGTNAVGISATPALVKQVWSSIDKWGAQSHVRLVFTMGGAHVMDFPSLVPITQPDMADGFIDVYADNGKGIHGHLWLTRVKQIVAVDLPGRDEVRTRTVSFYDAQGKLIIGVYASITTKKPDTRSVAGFKESWSLIKSLPQLCS